MRNRKALRLTVSVIALTAGIYGSITAANAGVGASADSCVAGDAVKLGFLNSTSGPMAISEQTVRDALILAAEEINAAGGILGLPIDYIEEDGQSEPTIFAEKVAKLLEQDGVAAVFGGWTSASRKAMLPVVEGMNGLLFYPVQYEGLEASPNIYYTGATTNQQIIPAMDFLAAQGVETLFLAGSDYVFPRTANKIIKQYAAELGIEIVGGVRAARQRRLGHPGCQDRRRGPTSSSTPSTVLPTSVSSRRTTRPGSAPRTRRSSRCRSPRKRPRWVSISPGSTPRGTISERRYPGERDTFIEAFQAKYGDDRPTSDPMEAAYTSLYLYKNIVEKAGSFCVDAVNTAAVGSFAAPEGLVTINGANHHIAKTGLIGQINADNQFDIVWTSDGPIEPDRSSRVTAGGTRRRADPVAVIARGGRGGVPRAIPAAPPALDDLKVR